MNTEQVKTILRYFYGISGQTALLCWEHDKWRSLHGSSDLVSATASGQLDRITVKTFVLHADAATVQAALDCLQSKDQRLLAFRYRNGYTWNKIAGCWGVPMRTVHRWHRKALERLGNILEDTPMIQELLLRALCAQD